MANENLSDFEQLLEDALNSSVALYEVLKDVNQTTSVRRLSRAIKELNTAVRRVKATASKTIMRSRILRSLVVSLATLCQEFKLLVDKSSIPSTDDQTMNRIKQIWPNRENSFTNLLDLFTATMQLTANSLTTEAALGHQEQQRALIDATATKLKARLESTTNASASISQSSDDLEESRFYWLDEEAKAIRDSLILCSEASKRLDSRRGSYFAQNATPQEPFRDSTDERLVQQRDRAAAEAGALKARIQVLTEKMESNSLSGAVHYDDVAALCELSKQLDQKYQLLQTLSDACLELRKEITIVENNGKGDTFQVMVTTDGKVLCGTNNGDGPVNRQIGGRMPRQTIERILEYMGYTVM